MFRISPLKSFIGQSLRVLLVTVFILVTIELSLTIVLKTKEALTPQQTDPFDYRVAADTYENSDWVQDYYREHVESLSLQWTPYTYWRRQPFQGSHINVNQDGRRLTINPRTPSQQQEGAESPLDIFVFGGSTMWGTGARDAFTIPSVLSRELATAGIAATVQNYGETGYVTTQELILLVLELQSGSRPDIVIFYDGVNDVFSAYQQSSAGVPHNEFNRRTEFNLSHPSHFRQRIQIVTRDILLRLATTRFLQQLFNQPEMEGHPRNRVNPEATDTLAREIVDKYAANIDAIQALSDNYQFDYLCYWQPTIFNKTNLTQYETKQRQRLLYLEPFYRQTNNFLRESSPGGESSAHRFHDLTHLFADTIHPIYIDWCHMGERGNEFIGKRMASDVLKLLARDN